MGKYNRKKTHRHAARNLKRQWISFINPHAQRFAKARVSFRLYHSAGAIFENPETLDPRHQPVNLLDNDVDSQQDIIEVGVQKVLLFAAASAERLRRWAQSRARKAIRPTASPRNPGPIRPVHN